MKSLLITVSAAALLAGCAQNDETSLGASGSGSSAAAGVAGVVETKLENGQLSEADAKVVRTAALSGMAEVRVGQLITEGAQNSALRDFGQRLVKDHTKANVDLIQIAAKKGASVPTQPTAKHEKMLTELSKLKGTEFDKAAQKHAIQHHQEDIQLFESASKTLQDSELKAFVDKTLPTLKEHLTAAKSIEGGATTSAEPSSATEE